MKLPPTIEAIIANVWAFQRRPRTVPWTRALVQEVAHEACRLQRDADRLLLGPHTILIDQVPLVVPKETA